jgi:hypothetical protein
MMRRRRKALPIWRQHPQERHGGDGLLSVEYKSVVGGLVPFCNNDDVSKDKKKR